jgi:hypothetical protein
MRVDTTVVESNIHYPTDSGLNDGGTSDVKLPLQSLLALIQDD